MFHHLASEYYKTPERWRALLSIIRVVAAAGGDILDNKYGTSPLARAHHKDVVVALTEHLKPASLNIGKLLFEKVRDAKTENDVGIILAMLPMASDEAIHYRHVEEGGFSLLHTLFFMLRAFPDRGEPPPLVLYRQLIEYLLIRGADVNAKDDANGFTSLHAAVYAAENYTLDNDIVWWCDVLQHLIEAGANKTINIRSTQGIHCLDLVRNPIIWEKLVSFGASMAE